MLISFYMHLSGKKDLWLYFRSTPTPTVFTASRKIKTFTHMRLQLLYNPCIILFVGSKMMYYIVSHERFSHRYYTGPTKSKIFYILYLLPNLNVYIAIFFKWFRFREFTTSSDSRTLQYISTINCTRPD